MSTIFDNEKKLAWAKKVLKIHPEIRPQMNDTFCRKETTFYPLLFFRVFWRNILAIIYEIETFVFFINRDSDLQEELNNLSVYENEKAYNDEIELNCDSKSESMPIFVFRKKGQNEQNLSKKKRN